MSNLNLQVFPDQCSRFFSLNLTGVSGVSTCEIDDGLPVRFSMMSVERISGRGLEAPSTFICSGSVITIELIFKVVFDLLSASSCSRNSRKYESEMGKGY
jgi:hypothetical protein